MAKQKKPTKFKNMLEGLDQFKVEHNFQYTNKEAKGTVVGFFISTLYFFIMGAYAYNRMHLFWTHDEDSFGSFDVPLDMDEEPDGFNLKDMKFSTGVLLDTHYPERYSKVFEDAEELAKYV